MNAAMKAALVVLASVGLSGCATYFEEQRLATEQQSYELAALKGSVNRLKEQVAALERNMEKADGQRAAEREELRQLRESVAANDRALRALDAARPADRQDILSQVSRSVADIVNKRAAAAPRAATRTERGVEHVVQSGQTLSQIAAAYKKKPSDIISANNLTNPNALRAGQKLFIPE